MNPMVKVPVVFGAIAGVLGGGLAIGLYYFGPHPFMIQPYADFRILLFGVFIFFTLKELREIHFNGVLYFSQALLASFVFLVVFALIGSTLIGSFAALNEKFLTDYIGQKSSELRNLPADIIEKIGKEYYDRNLATLPSTNSFDLATIYFTQSFAIGIFISIILSVLLRRQPKP